MRWTRAFLTATAMAVAMPASAELDLDRAEVTHLADGLTVIILEDHSFPVVSVQMLYKSGSAAETTGKTGLAHFMEHLAFRGSRNFPNERATELIYDAGGEWHGYTAFDQTTYFATMPRDGLDLLLKIEADRMARTVIDPASMEAERGAVITELHSYENDPSSVLQDAVARTAIQAHPYGSPMAGYVSDVEQLTAADAEAYYASHYAPGNAVLAIVGDFAPSKAHALVDQDFADVPARPVAAPRYTAELPQRGQRRIELSGPVDRQYFLVAFPSPAASNADFPAFLLLQEMLSGGAGLNLHQSDWSAAPSVKGSLLFGAAGDIATFLPPTRDPFLFTISGSIGRAGDRAALERDIGQRIARLADHPVTDQRLAEAKAAVIHELADDVQTTEDAAHQLAFFEGIGALDSLLRMPEHVGAVRAADVQRVARTYLRTNESTVGWMIPGAFPASRPGGADPKEAKDRPGAPAGAAPAPEPQLRRLSNGLPAIVQANPLSGTATVELLLDGPVEGGTHPQDFPGLDSVVRSGTARELDRLVTAAAAGDRKAEAHSDQPSRDPAARLQQLLVKQMDPRRATIPKPLAVIVSGNVQPAAAFAIVERDFGALGPGRIANEPPRPPTSLSLVRERIPKPLSQGALGYVVEGPANGTREALAWQLLLYVLTHDYSGRLGRSAITEKGIVYHIYSEYRTDGRRTWATISMGVDPNKADSMEAELRAQLAKLASNPPTAAELGAAKSHLLGRDLSSAQSNEELTAKLAREYIETGGLRSRDRLRADLTAITPADLARAAQAFMNGTIVRVDVDEVDQASP
ncbi:MAG TPA: insulinase family protein [Sphingomicrobium sp.]|jgi:zinc protease|nr:insulinase family protein [Sphingomicrobium sp.]